MSTANLQLLIAARNESQAALDKLNRDLRDAGSSSAITAANAKSLMAELNKANRAERDINRLNGYIRQLGGEATQSRTKMAGLWSGFQNLAGGFDLGGMGLGGLAGIAAITGATGAAAYGVSQLVSKGVDAAGALQRLGMATHTFQEETGASAETASGLLAVLARYDVDAAGASRSLGIFSKGIRGVVDEENGGAAAAQLFSTAITSLGVATQDAAGNVLPMDQILLAVADKFAAMPDGVVKTADAMALFGRSGKEMISFLNEGSDAIAGYMETAKRYGVVLGEDTVQDVKKLTLAQKDLDAATSGLGVRFGKLIMPLETSGVKALTDIAEATQRWSDLVGAGVPPLLAIIQATRDMTAEMYKARGGTDSAATGIRGINSAVAEYLGLMPRVTNAPIVGMATAAQAAEKAADAFRNSGPYKLLPDQLDAQIKDIEDRNGTTKKLADEVAAASKLGVGLTPDQLDAQRNAELDYLAAIGAAQRARADESAASKAASDAERAAAEARTRALQEATSAVQGLQSALDDLNRTPLLGTGAFDAEQNRLQDRINEIDLAQKQMAGQRGDRSQLRALAKERATLERQLAVSQASELVKLGPQQRTLQQALNPPLPEASLQDLLTRAAAARGGLLAAQSYQQTIQQTNNVNVRVDSGGNVSVQGGDAALGRAIADGVKQALSALISGSTTGLRASPSLSGAR